MSQVDIGVNCCQELSGDELIIENTIEDEIMEVVTEKEYTYAEYLRMIEAEEKIIEELDNEIENCENELEDIEISIDLAEAERLNKIKSVYQTVINRRKEKAVKLEKLEEVLEERRAYLHSLREEDEIEQMSNDRDDRDSLTSAMDTHIDPEITKQNGVYKISDNPYVIGTDGQVLF